MPIAYSAKSKSDIERLELFEASLGPLIDRHLRWTPINDSPSAALTDKEYGYTPQRFQEYDKNQPEVSLRPSQEPLNFRLIAGEVLGLEPENIIFEEEVRKIDGHGDFPDSPQDYTTEGWYRFLVRSGIDSEVVQHMKKISETAFRVSANTEDNVPAYTLETLGTIRKLNAKLGLELPAHEEWYRGLWTAEEDGHKDGQNDYGRIRRITTGATHRASANSQLRAGTAIETGGMINMAIYTTIQEYSTRLAHKRNALLFGPIGHRLQEEESQDETRHYDVYGGLARAAYHDERFTEEVICLLYQKDSEFSMPGSAGITDFRSKAVTIARAKIYGPEEEHEAIRMAMKRIGVLERDGGGNFTAPQNVSNEAQEMLQKLREKYGEKLEPKSRSGLFVLGQTLTIPELKQLHKEYARAKNLPTLQNKRIRVAS